jgi:catalase
MRTANIAQDAGVIDANDENAFITVAKTRQWDREKSVRTLA